MIWRVVLTCAALLGVGFVSGSAAEAPTLLSIHGNKTVLEIAPVLLAADRFYPATVKMGGIPNLIGDPGIPGFSEPGRADLATHAETQALRYSVKHPDIRIVLTVTEGLYRIVARRSAGIAWLADLKGKRVATVPNTSAGYFLHRMLRWAGLTDADVTWVPVSPLSDMPKALAAGTVDAVAVWEPESQRAAEAIGADAVEFSGRGIYRELFNLNTTEANLRDPAMRKRIVAFVRAVIAASQQIEKDPSVVWPMNEKASGFDRTLLERAWPHHAWVATLPPDLLDVLVDEEQWLAVRDKRPARGRAELARLIDPSILAEANTAE